MHIVVNRVLYHPDDVVVRLRLSRRLPQSKLLAHWILSAVEELLRERLIHNGNLGGRSRIVTVEIAARKQGSFHGLEIARADIIQPRRFLGIRPVFANDIVVRAVSTDGRTD